MIAAAGHRVSVEPRNSYMDSNKRPDIRISNFHGLGAHADVDVGTVSVVGDAVYESAARMPGFAADLVESRKHGEWKQVVDAEDCHNTITVVAYELGGRWGNEALKFFNDIARSATSTSAAANAFKSYWTRRVGTAMQKAYGRLLRSRVPPVAGPKIAGVRARPAPLAHILDNPNPPTIYGSAPRVHFDDTPRVAGARAGGQV